MASAGLRGLFASVSSRRRTQLGFVTTLTIVGAIAELVTIGAVVPVMVVASDPDRTSKIPFLGSFIAPTAAALDVSALAAAALVLTVAAVVATALRLCLNSVTQRFVYGLHRDLVLAIFHRILRQPYSWYSHQNSSVLLAAVEKVYLVAVGVVSPLVNALSSAFMAFIIAGFLIVINATAALIAIAVVGSIYLAMSFTTRRIAHRISSTESYVRSARLKIMQESLGGIREIIIDQTHPVFERKMAQLEEIHSRLLGQSTSIAQTPRIVVEGAVIILVAALALWFNLQPGGVLHALPVLGAMALGSQRLLPMVQLVYYGFSNYSFHRNSVDDVVELLELTTQTDHFGANDFPATHFSRQIELRRVSYRYETSREALADVSLKIRKGEKVGIIGKTGSGKSTIVDILLGLIEPTNGAVIIDDVELRGPRRITWKSEIAHVPQTIFLSDDSIVRNIAFGQETESIDLVRVSKAAHDAGLQEFVSELPLGLATTIGERGVRLSGGQRQRIGIARALYKNSSVLILDEATSALDDETERAVMGAVELLSDDITVILVAHRLTTLAKCDRIFRLEGGRIVETGSYDDVIRRISR